MTVIATRRPDSCTIDLQADGTLVVYEDGFVLFEVKLTNPEDVAHARLRLKCGVGALPEDEGTENCED